MFNRQNFCHIASNNRNDVKAGVFVYKTMDDLDTVSANGYFNDQIIDINLHDLIIHEWHDPTDRTNVEYNLLCVTERTLDNVGTSLIMSNWEKGVEETIADLDDKYVKKTGDTMSGALAIKKETSSSTYSIPLLSLCASYNGSDNPIELGVAPNGSNLYLSGSLVVNSEVIPKSSATSPKRLGGPLNGQHWDCVYTRTIYNGYSLNVPQKAGTLATIEDVNDALANAGSSLTTKGVWYAQMYAGTTPPAAEDGTNYADFSQVDGQGNPIIVIYERQNGAWVQTETITPPANYNGYVMVTSKIWDIPEQSGQQGGQVNWDCVHKTFTPYPKIVSFENAALTGNSTVQMPITPTNDSIVNKDYVDTAIAGATVAAGFDLFDWKWKDYTMSKPGWALSDGNWKTSATAYAHLADDIDQQTLQTETIAGVTVSFYQAADGHKICPADQETNVNAIYAATGIAWYYIIDTDNQLFKLPRTTHGFVGIRTNPGEYVAPTVPNIKAGIPGVIFVNGGQTATGAAKLTNKVNNNLDNTSGTGEARANIEIDASTYNSAYQDNATVQAPATQAYLYFYIGQ